jgi:inorganic triphosphatase YgiF
MRNQPPIRQYAVEQITSRLGRLVFECKRCGKALDPDAVHDLRVSIRRLNQSLRTFGSLLPDGEPRKVRRQARRLMRLAGEIRNRDVALEWMARDGVARRSALRSRRPSTFTRPSRRIRWTSAFGQRSARRSSRSSRCPARSRVTSIRRARKGPPRGIVPAGVPPDNGRYNGPGGGRWYR